MNRLPTSIRACLFDLDGVLTKTTALHARAWRETFEAFLSDLAARTGAMLVPFMPADYARYVDGRTRLDAVGAFLASRGIELDEGARRDLAERKSARVRALIREQGVEVYDDAVRFARFVRDAGLRTAVVSSSTSCHEAMKRAEIEELFDVVVDGIVAERERLRSKPAPDTFAFAARALGMRPSETAVFEDAAPGILAAKRGRFGFVVGVDRLRLPDVLRMNGADVVVSDLTELLEPLKTGSSASSY